MHVQTILLLAFAIASEPGASEVRVKAFDLEETQASYVVSLPDDYDKSKRWPLIVDFHGAISPAQKGANITRDRLWSKFVNKSPFIVVGLNGRTRAWGMTKGDEDDIAYALHVLEQIRKKYSVDAERIYLAGFSSGSDFLCRAGLQLKGAFAGSLVVCPGPPSVVGLRGGELLRAKERPFFFMTGEEDYVRKEGAWQAFVALDDVGAKAIYREVPRVGHSFPSVDEYARAIEYLESMAQPDQTDDPLTIARQAAAREDFLLASTQLLPVESDEAKTLLSGIRERGEALLKIATEIDAAKEPGKAYEAWWHIRTQFHRFPKLTERAQTELEKLEEAIPRRDLYRHRRDWFRSRRTPTPKDDQSGSTEMPTRQPTVARASEATWHVDHYFNYDEAAEFVRDLARRFPHRARLVHIGKSLEGRDLLALEITDLSTGDPSTKPAIYVQGAMHGNEISSMMALLYMAEQMVANPTRSRGTDRLMRRATVYAVPVVNPDAVHHFMTEPHSHWRPRYNSRPFDDDDDGRVDEDPYEDLDGDGEIGLMYQLAEDGDFVLKDGRIARGEGEPRYKLIAREGTDNDKDGKYSEDRPGGVDLNRNFPVGFRSRRAFGGTSGSKAASEPETKAVVDFVSARPNINLFFDYHNAANCVFYWTGPQHAKDVAFYDEVAQHAESVLGYQPRPLRHTGSGLAIAWAYGTLGTPSFIVELEPGRGDPSEYYATAWKKDALIRVKKFKHPQLGEVLIGNDVKKIPKRNPHPRDLAWQADRNWNWIKHWLGQLPKLELRQPKIKRTEIGFVVTGEVANAGAMPTEFDMAKMLKRAAPVTISVEGAVLAGTSDLGSLAVGEVKPFSVELAEPSESVTLIVQHPRAGTVRLPILRPKSASIPVRSAYEIQKGYATPDKAKLADNDFYKDGVSDRERGPAFELKHRKDELRIAVLLGEWRDQRHTVKPRQFEQAFFSDKTYTSLSPTGQRVYGSLRDFYHEMSYGKMKVTGRVFDWIELPVAGQNIETPVSVRGFCRTD